MSESKHQETVIRWAEFYSEDSRKIFAVPNGTHIASKAGRAKAKREGLKKGVPDLMLPVARGGFNGLFIEMKKPKDAVSGEGRPTQEQRDRINELKQDGYMAVFCVGCDSAIDTITNYLRLK